MGGRSKELSQSDPSVIGLLEGVVLGQQIPRPQNGPERDQCLMGLSEPGEIKQRLNNLSRLEGQSRPKNGGCVTVYLGSMASAGPKAPKGNTWLLQHPGEG